MRAAGDIPRATSLWAVANPVTERDAARAAEKVDAGAEVLLTQPPLDWENFEAWWDDAERRGVLSAAKVLVGFPALSSSANAAFWLALAGGARSAGARAVVRAFADAEARGKGAAAAFAADYSERQLQQVRARALCFAVPEAVGASCVRLVAAVRALSMSCATPRARAGGARACSLTRHSAPAACSCARCLASAGST